MWKIPRAFQLAIDAESDGRVRAMLGSCYKGQLFDIPNGPKIFSQLVGKKENPVLIANVLFGAN